VRLYVVPWELRANPKTTKRPEPYWIQHIVDATIRQPSRLIRPATATPLLTPRLPIAVSVRLNPLADTGAWLTGAVPVGAWVTPVPVGA
jgi:hypothetical protein